MRRSVPTPWAAKGSVMRTVMEAAGTRPVDTTDGVRIVDAERGWVLVLPDPARAVTHLWAEGGDADSAQLLLDEWGAIVEGAGQSDASRHCCLPLLPPPCVIACGRIQGCTVGYCVLTYADVPFRVCAGGQRHRETCAVRVTRR